MKGREREIEGVKGRERERERAWERLRREREREVEQPTLSQICETCYVRICVHVLC